MGVVLRLYPRFSTYCGRGRACEAVTAPQVYYSVGRSYYFDGRALQLAPTFMDAVLFCLSVHLGFVCFTLLLPW